MSRIIRHHAVKHDVNDDVGACHGQTGNASSLGSAHARTRPASRHRDKHVTGNRKQNIIECAICRFAWPAGQWWIITRSCDF